MSRLQEYNPIFGVVFEDPPKPKWLQDLEAEEEAEKAKGGGAQPKAPAAPTGGLSDFPPGTKFPEGSTTRGIAPNGLWYEKQADGSVKEGYVSSQTDRNALGVGPRTASSSGGGTTTSRPSGAQTNFTQQNIANERAAQLATGKYVEAPPPGYTLINNGAKAVGPGGAYAWDNTSNLWYPTFATKDERAEATRIGMAQPGTGTTTPQPVVGLSPEARPFAGGAAFIGPGGTLDVRGGPVVPGFEAFRQPGIGIPSEGRQTLYTGQGLNTINTGRQGSAQQIPIAPGYRLPGQTGNSISFASGASGGGRAEPQMLFPSVAVSVPDTYVLGQGNANDSNRAYSVPFNIGPGGAALANVAGNNVQINSADKGVGYGYALNAMPASNVGAVTGRDLSNDPATQAAQILQLNAAMNQMGGGAGAIAALTATNANQYGGYRAGTGNDPYSGNGGTGQGTWFAGYDPEKEGAGGDGFMRGYAKGGSVATGPLGAKPDQVTNGPVVGVRLDALQQGRIVPEFIVGEGDANRDGRFDPELLSIKPLRGYAEGGDVTTEEEDTSDGGIGRMAGYMAAERQGMTPEQIDYLMALEAARLGSDYGPIHGQALLLPNYVPGENYRWAENRQSERSGLPGYGFPEGRAGQITIMPQTPGIELTNQYDPFGSDPPRGIQQYATGGTVTTAPATTSAPVTTLPPLPTMPALDQTPVLDTGPEVQSALRSAQIAQQQASQNNLRARAGLGGTIGIRTNANLTGLAPGYYTTPADYSQQIGDLQTQLAGLGAVSSNPNALLGYSNTLKQMLDPLKEAQGIQTQLSGLGELGDPNALQQQINTLQQQIEPLTTAQQIQLKRLGLGQVGNADAINNEIITLKQQAGPLSRIQEVNQKLTELGQPKDLTDLYNQIEGIKNQMAQLGNPDPFANPSEFQVWNQANQALSPLQNLFQQEQQRNNQIIELQNGLANLLAAAGTTMQQIGPQLAAFQSQLDLKEQAYKNALEAAELEQQLLQYAPAGTDIGALLGQYRTQLDTAQTGFGNIQKAAELRAKLANYVPEGTDLNARIGEITGGINSAQSAYDATLKAQELQAQIEAYRKNTDIQGTDVNDAPAPVIAQAVVSTPVLKQIAQSDAQSANALARLDYAMSDGGTWTPATSQLLVNLTNSLSGSKAKDSVQALLQSLIGRMPQSANVPPAIAAAASTGDSSRIAAAAKFGAAA